MRFKRSLGRKKTSGVKKPTRAAKIARTMKFAGVQISARLQKPVRIVRRVRAAKHSTHVVVEKRTLPALSALPAPVNPVNVVHQPYIPTPARAGSGIGALGMATCAIAMMTGALLFAWRPDPDRSAATTIAPAKGTVKHTQAGPHPQVEMASLGMGAPIPAPRPAQKAAPVNHALPVSHGVDAQSSDSQASVIEAPALVTITGCLENESDAFKLKDTSGAAAPTGRSWKSGFLKRRSSSIDVIDTMNSVSLADHVGQRVSLTGTLVDRDMQVRSLQRVAVSCKD